MTIEIRQMLIKSTVNHDRAEGNSGMDQALEDIKEEILEACRQMVREILREGRER